VEDEDLEIEDLDKGPEGEPMEEPKIEDALAMEYKLEPKVTHLKQGRCGRMCREHAH